MSTNDPTHAPGGPVQGETALPESDGEDHEEFVLGPLPPKVSRRLRCLPEEVLAKLRADLDEAKARADRAEARLAKLAGEELGKRIKSAIATYCSCPLPPNRRHGDPVPERCKCDDQADDVRALLGRGET